MTSLCFNTLSRFVIAFLPKNKCFFVVVVILISWLQSPSTLISEPKKIKSVTVSIFSSSICHELMGPDAMIFVFLYAELDEAQAGIEIARRNINNLRYTGDRTIMAESEEQLKSLLKVKEWSEKVGLKLNIQKTKIMASGPITSWQIDGEKMETVTDFIFLGSKITTDGECSYEIKRCLLLR